MFIENVHPHLLLPIQQQHLQKSYFSTQHQQHAILATLAAQHCHQQQQHCLVTATQQHMSLPMATAASDDVPSTAAIIEDIAEIEDNMKKQSSQQINIDQSGPQLTNELITTSIVETGNIIALHNSEVATNGLVVDKSTDVSLNLNISGSQVLQNDLNIGSASVTLSGVASVVPTMTTISYGSLGSARTVHVTGNFPIFTMSNTSGGPTVHPTFSFNAHNVQDKADNASLSNNSIGTVDVPVRMSFCQALPGISASENFPQTVNSHSDHCSQPTVASESAAMSPHDDDAQVTPDDDATQFTSQMPNQSPSVTKSPINTSERNSLSAATQNCRDSVCSASVTANLEEYLPQPEGHENTLVLNV